MSLYKYLKKGGPALPTPRTCGDSSPSKKDIEQANKEVKRTLGDWNQSGKKAVTPRGKYNSYTPEERAKIGKYAAENGATRAARYFSELLDRKITESTARRLKSEYLQAIARDRDAVVKRLPTKEQGRPLLLGPELDKAVQEYVEATRAVGVVNTAIVMAAAVGIVSARDLTKLSSHGGHIQITKPWAKSLLTRMGYVKRKCSNAGKISVTRFAELQEVFFADIKAQVLMNDIPDELVINWDQTALPLVPTGEWTMHRAGEKMIPIAKSDDKRQITAVFAASMTARGVPCITVDLQREDRTLPSTSVVS